MTTYDLEILIRTKKVGDDPSPPPDSGLKWTELASKVSLAKQAFATVAAGAKLVYDTLKRGAELEAARGRFDNLTRTINTTGDALLGKLRDATKGMVSDAELIAGASDIISLGLAKNEGDTVRLATAVSTLGLDMQQVILTFANNSKARLDSLGLSVEGVTQKAAELQAQGFTGDAFDEAVLIGLEEKMTLLGDASQTTAGKIAIMEASIANLKDAGSVLVSTALEPAVSAAAGMASNTVKIVEAVQSSKSPLGDMLFALNEVNKALGGIPMDDWIADLRAAEINEQAAVARAQEMTEYYQAQAAAIEAARQEVVDKANADRDAAHASGGLAAQSDQLNEQMERTAAVAEGAADRIAYLAEQDEIAAAARARLVEAFDASAEPINALFAAQDDLAAAEGEWVTRTVSTAGQVSAINAQLAADLTNEQKGAYQEILRTVDEGSAEWLAAYNALQNDLTDSQRQALIAQQAALADQPDGLVQVYTGDAAAAEEAQARIAAANEAIRQSYRETAAEALLAQTGVTEATLDTLVAIGYMTEEQAAARLEFANTTTAIEDLAASSEYARLTADEQAAALNALIDGTAKTADEAINLATQQTAVNEALSAMPKAVVSTVTIRGLDDAGSRIGDILRQLDALDGRNVSANVTVNTFTPEDLGGGGGGKEPPKKAAGGPVAAGKLYQVGEGNRPELYMIPGDNGRIFSNAESQALLSGGGGSYVDNSQTVIYNRTQEAAAMTQALVNERRKQRLNQYMGVS